MKLKNLFYVAAIAMSVGVFFTACSQSSNKSASATDTEMSIEKGDETAKCGGESKCGEGKESTDSTAKCGDGKESTDSTAKCGEGKCGA